MDLTRTKWLQTDEQIIAYIVRSVSIPIRLSIRRLTTSMDQWLALSRMFVQTGATQEYQLLQSFQDAKLEDRCIQDFYVLLSGYWKELHTMEAAISDAVLSAAPSFALELEKQRNR